MSKLAGDAGNVAVIVGATSKWQADGANTRIAHGGPIDSAAVPVGARWGVGGAVAMKFAQEGYLVVLTTRNRHNARELMDAIDDAGGRCITIELDLDSNESIAGAFDQIRREAGDPQVVIYNAGYMIGRSLPAEMELLEFFPADLFAAALRVAALGPFLVAKEVLPAMRNRGSGSIIFSNNQHSLRGRKRQSGASLYYPRVMMRALAQALTEEYSEHGVHVANVIIDGMVDSPGTRALPASQENPDMLLNPLGIADAMYYIHQQDRSCWTHEIQLTPYVCALSH